jgi:intracellular multiplication protein IcmQ
MLQTEQEIQVALEIKKILDEGIAAGPWQANLFLKGIKKKLEELRDDFVTRVGLDRHHEQIATLAAKNCENTEVYIALYQSQGGNMNKWQEVVASLVNYTMGRPIYYNEADVQAAIRLSDRNLNHAYVVVNVHSDAILSDTAELVRTDREGRKLIRLREAAIHLKNIVRLVHATGQYKLVRNFLVKQN